MQAEARTPDATYVRLVPSLHGLVAALVGLHKDEALVLHTDEAPDAGTRFGVTVLEARRTPFTVSLGFSGFFRVRFILNLSAIFCEIFFIKLPILRRPMS